MKPIWRALADLLERLRQRPCRTGALAKIENIPTEQFNALLDSMCAEGWRKKNEYDGFDAWIDYGYVELRKGKVKLTFEWTNWFEGTISGPPALIEPLAEANGLKVAGYSQPGGQEGAP